MLSKSVFGLALLVLATGTAFAAKYQPMQATFGNAIATRANTIVLADIAWRCEASTCASVSDTNKATDMRSCKSLARKFGAVKSFAGTNGEFDAEKLAKCNEGAKS